MSIPPRRILPPHALVWAALGLVALASLAGWAYQVHHVTVVSSMRQTAAFLLEMPWPVFYLAIGLLPFVFFPVSLLYLSAGAVHGIVPSMIGIVVAMAVNISLGYWLAVGPLRGFIQRWFDRRGRTVPVLPEGEQVWAVLVVRFTPAIPLMAQNYLLGLARVPFWKYFWISLGAEAVIAFGYIVAGEALTEKKPGFVLLAFGCIIGALLLTRGLRRAFARKVDPVVSAAVSADPKDSEPI